DDNIEQLRSSGANREVIKQARGKAEREMRNALKKAREAAAEAGTAKMSPQILAIMDVIDSFLQQDAISVRFLACGDDDPHLGFVGSLLGRDDYIQRERDALFSRYGSILRGWTAVLQVAAVPSEAERDASRNWSSDGLDLLR